MPKMHAQMPGAVSNSHLAGREKGDWHCVLTEVAFINAYDVDVNDHLCLEPKYYRTAHPAGNFWAVHKNEHANESI